MVTKEIEVQCPMCAEYFGTITKFDETEETELLREALNSCIIVKNGDVFYRTSDNIPMDIPERIAKKIRVALGLK